MIFRTWETLGQLPVAGPRRQIQDTRQRDPMHPPGCCGKPRQTHYTGLQTPRGLRRATQGPLHRGYIPSRRVSDARHHPHGCDGSCAVAERPVCRMTRKACPVPLVRAVCTIYIRPPERTMADRHIRGVPCLTTESHGALPSSCKSNDFRLAAFILRGPEPGGQPLLLPLPWSAVLGTHRIWRPLASGCGAELVIRRVAAVFCHTCRVRSGGLTFPLDKHRLL